MGRGSRKGAWNLKIDCVAVGLVRPPAAIGKEVWGLGVTSSCLETGLCRGHGSAQQNQEKQEVSIPV